MTPSALRHDVPARSFVLDPEFLRDLEVSIERQIRRIMRTVDRVDANELQRGGDEADLTASRLGHAEELSVRARCADGLVEWSEALDRLRSSPATFGLCSQCQTPIQRERLEILPTARTCVACQ